MANKEATLLLRIKTLGQDALGGIQNNFDTLKTAAFGAFAAISGVVVKSLADYREQEIATNSLTQAMVNNGIYSKELKDDYLAQASAIQKLTLFGDEQIIQAQAIMQMGVGEQRVTKDLTMAVADLAQAKGMDLNSAAQMVAKTIGSNNNLLSRQGIEFDNNTRGAERMAAVTEALNKKFGGQATAATDGLGALKQLGNAVSDLMEMFGEKLAPIVSMVARALKGFAEDTSQTTPIMDAFVSALQFIGVVGIEIFGVINKLTSAIAIGLSAAVASSSQALSGEFAMALETVKTGFQTIKDESLRIEGETLSARQALLTAHEEAQRASLEREKQNLATSLMEKAEMKQAHTEEEDAKELEHLQMKQEMELAQHQLDLATKTGNQDQILQAQIAHQNAIINSDASHKAKMKAQEEKHKLQMQQMDNAAAAAKLAAMKDVFSTIATMSNSSNSTMAAIGKAAALTQIAIDTPVAVGRALAAFPPPFNAVAAAAVGAAMANQAAQVAGIPLAEGGIVMPRQGGVQATIAEAGQPEVVIPLDRAEEFGLGGGKGGITINVYGGLLGDERTAQEFAAAVDKRLLQLRQNGESVAFDNIS